jgi:hypothetical protein
VLDCLLPSSVDSFGARSRSREDQYKAHHDRSARKIDVETPAPGDLVRKHATEKRARDVAQSSCCAEKGHIQRSLSRRSREGNDGCSSGGNPRSASAGDGSANDERSGVGCKAADETAELEDCDGEYEGKLHGKVRADLSPERPERAEGEEIHGAVPGDLLETVEFICDFGHSRADDCLCLVRVLFLWSEDCDGGDDAR